MSRLYCNTPNYHVILVLRLAMYPWTILLSTLLTSCDRLLFVHASQWIRHEADIFKVTILTSEDWLAPRQHEVRRVWWGRNFFWFVCIWDCYSRKDKDRRGREKRSEIGEVKKMEEMEYPASFAISRFGEANYFSKIKKHFFSSRQILRKCKRCAKERKKKKKMLAGWQAAPTCPTTPHLSLRRKKKNKWLERKPCGSGGMLKWDVCNCGLSMNISVVRKHTKERKVRSERVNFFPLESFVSGFHVCQV